MKGFDFVEEFGIFILLKIFVKLGELCKKLES